MTRNARWLLIPLLTVSVSLPGAAGAQNPAFLEVSIRPVAKDAPALTRDAAFSPVQTGAKYEDPRTTVATLVAFAYGIQDVTNLLEGLPDWATSKMISISAQAHPEWAGMTESENLATVRLMMRSLLEDRYQLVIHSDTRDDKIFRMELAKGGLRIKQVDPPVFPAHEGNVSVATDAAGGRISAQKATMSGVARMLSQVLKRPVVDSTVLHNYYDLDLKWTGTSTPDDVARVVQDQLGLKLTAATGPQKHWVVDALEEPDAN